MHVEAAGKDDENVFILLAWRQQQFAFAKIAPIAILQQFLHIIGTHALEQLESLEQ